MSESSRPHDRSVVIVGSGFGGSVTACRLAEAGYQVTVLERGRRWTRFPRGPNDPWIYDSRNPAKWNGWVEFHLWRKMAVATGAGVGGGSLIYANVSEIPPEHTFERGWPKEITYEVLKPHYDEAGRVLAVAKVPDGQLSERFRVVREAAEAIGDGARFRKLNLAVSFAEGWKPGEDSREVLHKQPVEARAPQPVQGTCVHCGNCDLGCEFKAKNTLDFNYLWRAENAGAEVRSLCQVEHVEPVAGGYRVHYWEIDPKRRTRTRRTVSARRVILSAGSLGSTEILLRSREKHLPRLSPFLGRNWSSNGDFLTFARYPGRRIDPSRGVTISCGIDYLRPDESPAQFMVEDGGLPPVLRNYLLYVWGNRLARALPPVRPFIRRRMEKLRHTDYAADTMPWFANGVDGADGRLRLGRRWYTPWRRELMLDWDLEASRAMFDGILAQHLQLTRATGGKPSLFRFFYELTHSLVTPHPLGGCNLGDTPETGVVNHAGEVFAYPDLYVADGAVVPEAVGLNPSRTIAAVAERIAAIILENDRRPLFRAPEKLVGANALEVTS
jgi:cholesterol oxidase